MSSANSPKPEKNSDVFNYDGNFALEFNASLCEGGIIKGYVNDTSSNYLSGAAVKLILGLM